MEEDFKHISTNLTEKNKVVYTAISKHLFYFKEHISKFVLEQNCISLNPYMLFNYFLLDTVDRNKIRQANNNLARISDEIWVFGKISDGVLAEIKIAKESGKPIRYFKIIESREIKEIQKEDVEFEEGLEKYANEL